MLTLEKFVNLFFNITSTVGQLKIELVIDRLTKSLKKLPKLEISQWSVLRVQMGKSILLEHAQLANQIQGFRIPDR